eukprot:g66877.t1
MYLHVETLTFGRFLVVKRKTRKNKRSERPKLTATSNSNSFLQRPRTTCAFFQWAMAGCHLFRQPARLQN